MSQLSLEKGGDLNSLDDGWVELASRDNDGLHAVLLTLGEIAMADTPAKVVIVHENGISLRREGALSEVAPVYHHPMTYVEASEARIAYPPAA